MTRRCRPSTTPYGRGPPPHGFAAGRIKRQHSTPKPTVSRPLLFARHPSSVAACQPHQSPPDWFRKETNEARGSNSMIGDFEQRRVKLSTGVELDVVDMGPKDAPRSEEPKSELQSLMRI